MQTAEIRRRFLEFFTADDHTLVPSASLIADDPTLLLVNAGMVPFKPYFLGEQTPPHKRAVSVQKCVRTLDIEEVGKTSRHGSFFQMCGNFSFGDYFKERAIPLAWRLLTSPVDAGGYGFDPERLWPTVYVDDDEAADIWVRDVGVDPDRVQRRGMVDNYWSMGVPGPCGPCSEIYYDRGPEYGREGGPVVDEERYLEVWNLVFMQFERGEGSGKTDFPILGPLPAPNIDTGMGLERMATLLQGVDNLYETDDTYPVLAHAAALAGKRYGDSPQDDVRLRVVADHVRTGLMLIADGVIPGNEGRGYVLRRILRRVVRSMRLLGYGDPALPELLPVSRDCMAPSYPEVAADFGRISTYAYAEEEAFRSTLRAGTTIFDGTVRELRDGGGTELPGEQAFLLHDTYGFPYDLTLEMAEEQGLAVDEAGFRRLMGEQRRRARADAQARKSGGLDLSAYRELLSVAGASTFTGYTETVRESTVRGLVVGGASAAAAVEGDEVEVALDVTPFYAEGGGQLADEGRLLLDGVELAVLDVQRPLPDLVVHRARVVRGELRVGSAVLAEVDVARRLGLSRAHTATHLVHKAMRDALGEGATQAGSENRPGRFRFDFASPGPVPASVLTDVEQTVNEVLLRDLDVSWVYQSQAEAVASGAMALFGEKYGERVRVVSIGDYARELCGGTHVRRSAQVGAVKILGEASIGSGVRRVEALVGLDAFTYLATEHALLSQVAALVNVPSGEVPDRVADIVARLRAAEKELERLRADAVLQAAASLAAGAVEVDGVAVVAAEAPVGTDAGDVRALVLDVRNRLGAARPAVVAVAARGDGRASVVVATNDHAREHGLAAGALVTELAAAVGGRGGGKPDLAQGGGSDPDGVPAALAMVPDLVRAALGEPR